MSLNTELGREVSGHASAQPWDLSSEWSWVCGERPEEWGIQCIAFHSGIFLSDRRGLFSFVEGFAGGIKGEKI